MRRPTRRNGPDTGVVTAAQRGDRQALEHLVARWLPLVYNIVGRALNGHADVDDVVQETMFRAVRGLSELRDPGAFRSWLVAIAVRQVRDRERQRQQAYEHSAQLESAEQIPDPALDFAGLTVLRLGLTDQRREVAEATRWLGEDDRELLSLWWLEETGELSRSELAAGLGLSDRHAAVRVQRMKEQVEIARVVVRALSRCGAVPGGAVPGGAMSGDAASAAAPPTGAPPTAAPPTGSPPTAAPPGIASPGPAATDAPGRDGAVCGELRALTANWDGAPSPLWRKRFARHVRGCGDCAGLDAELLPMDRLLSGLPLLPVPFALDPGHLASIAAGHHAAGAHPTDHPVAHHSPGADTAGGHGTGAHPPGHRAPGRAGRRNDPARPRRPGRLSRVGRHPLAAGAAAAAAVVAGALVAAQLIAAPPATTAEKAPAPAASVSAPPSPTASPSPSPSRTKTEKPKAKKPKQPRSESRKAPAAQPRTQAAASGKKGVGVWQFDGASQALDRSGASWYYTWSTSHDGISTPAGTGFVPMIWGRDAVTPDALAQAKAAGPYLLGFNEPDMAAQSNMSVDQALGLWPQLMDAGQVLGSPAVATGGDQAGGWLDRFMSGAAAKNYRVDFITLHWYGGDFNTPAAVDQLKSYLQAVHDRYHKPIWLTEYALIDFSQGTRFPSDEQQASFVTASTKMLAGLSYVQRYAWFGLGAKDDGPSSGLYRSGPVATAAGRAFEAAD